MKVKIIEPVQEVWWETTCEAVIEIDGEQFTVRVNESPKWGRTLVLIDDEWHELGITEMTPALEKLERLLKELHLAEFDTLEASFDFDPMDSGTII